MAPALLAALALVSPCDCAGCGAPDVELCAECRSKLRARPLLSALPDGTPLVSAHDYAGVVRDTVLAFKQQGRLRLGRPLGVAMGAALDLSVSAALGPPVAAAGLRPAVAAARGPRPARESRLQPAGGPEPHPAGGLGPHPAGGLGPHPAGGSGSGSSGAIALVAVPSSPAGRRRRGYEPVALLLAATDARPWAGGLRLARASGTQKSRGRSARLASRVGSMRADPRLSGVRVLVVDDVMTSGGTLLEAARALREVGADVVGACCLAATPLVSDGVR